MPTGNKHSCQYFRIYCIYSGGNCFAQNALRKVKTLNIHERERISCKYIFAFVYSDINMPGALYYSANELLVIVLSE